MKKKCRLSIATQPKTFQKSDDNLHFIINIIYILRGENKSDTYLINKIIFFFVCFFKTFFLKYLN